MLVQQEGNQGGKVRIDDGLLNLLFLPLDLGKEHDALAGGKLLQAVVPLSEGCLLVMIAVSLSSPCPFPILTGRGTGP